MRKKLFAVIMSAMMMITFMPSMAFAADTVVWGDKCASLTVNGASYTVKRVWNSDGSITASVDTSAYAPGMTLPTTVTRTFYDLDSAVIEPTYSTMTTTEFTNLFGNPATAAAKTAVTVKLTAPNYCSNYDGLSAGAKVKAGVDLAGVATLTVDTPVYDVEKQFENQTFTIKATATPVLDATKYVYGGANLTKTFTVQPTLPANASAVAILIDGKKALTTSSTTGIDLDGYVDYDVAEHSVAIQKAPGFTATYQVWNAEKGLWEDVDVIKATNVGTVDAKVTVKNSNNTADVVTKRIQFDIDPVEVEFRFDEKGLTASDTYYFEVSDDYKTVDYVKAYPDDLWGSSATAPEHFAYDKACKAAVKANQALLMEYFNDFYEIETQDGMFPVGSTPTKATMAVIKAKDLTALTLAEKDALLAKYGKLLKNFDVSNVTRNNITTTSYMLSAGTGDYAYFVVVPNTKTNDVDFIGSATKKVHIKNAAKIKKAKTVTIKAEAMGVAPKFKKLSGNSKIKVAASGKVTLKKGLKKGTYKVKVKAYSPEGKGYKYAKATRTYTIKVAGMCKSIDSSIDHDRFMELLKSTSRDVGTPGYDTSYGWGIVDYGNMLDALVPEDNSIWSAEITGISSNADYTGNEITFENLKITMPDGTELSADSDYTVAYYNNTNADMGMLTLQGIGSYTGRINKYFTINGVPHSGGSGGDSGGGGSSGGYSSAPIGGSDPVVEPEPEDEPEPIVETAPVKIAKTVIKTLKAGKKSFTIKWKKTKNVDGYQLQYSTKKDFRKSARKTITISKKKTSYTVKKLKAGKKYYIRMRGYRIVDGKRTNSTWTKIITTHVK